jgi:hypothetical protein
VAATISPSVCSGRSSENEPSTASARSSTDRPG